MKKTMKRSIIILVMLMIMTTIGQAAPIDLQSTGEISVERIAGSTRVQTAIEASKLAYRGGTETVVLAGYRGEVDALTGTLLANAKKAPLLLTAKNKLSDGVLNQLQELKAKYIILLGGTSAISEEVKIDLEAKGYKVSRVSGANRAATAVEVAKEVVGEKTNHIFLALGYNNQLADALAIGPVSGIKNIPVLLTQKTKLPGPTIEAIRDLGVKQVTIIGGTGAISLPVEKELKAKRLKVNRINGKNREETALEIAKNYFDSSERVLVASGWNYADALVGGYMGAMLKSPIVLTNTNKLSLPTKRYIRENASSSYVLGGEKVVSNSVLKTVRFANEVSKEDASFIGNRNTMKFHRLVCRVLPDEKNQVYFEMRKDATSQGFDPCGVCKP